MARSVLDLDQIVSHSAPVVGQGVGLSVSGLVLHIVHPAPTFGPTVARPVPVSARVVRSAPEVGPTVARPVLLMVAGRASRAAGPAPALGTPPPTPPSRSGTHSAYRGPGDVTLPLAQGHIKERE